MEADADDDELLNATATPEDELRAATEARAPPANEHNSSDEGVTDAHNSDDEGGYALSPGAWVVLHSLQGNPAINGQVGFAMEATSGAGGESRWLVQVMPTCETLKVKPTNFHVVAPADWEKGSEPERAAAEQFARCILEAFAADSSGPAKLAFPICATHHNKSRSVVHGVVRDMQDHFYDSHSLGPSGNRQLVVERIEKKPLALPPPSDTAGATSNDLSLSKFDELCALLDAMDGVPNETRAIEKRKRMSERFWRGVAPSGRQQPRHARPGLFGVVRLLVPHHDSRRYGLSVERLAAAMAEGLGIGKVRAKRLGKTWMLDESVALGDTGDVSLVLEALAKERVDPRRTPTLTVGAVNESLDAMQYDGKVDLLLRLTAQITKPREIKWLTRILLRDLRIGSRPSNPVPQKGEYPKIVMDGFCRAKGRLGKPSDQSAGSPPLMYTMLRYQNNLERVCEAAQSGMLPRAYPPPVRLGIHIRAQLSVPCPSLDAAALQLGTSDVYVETKYDGFRFQLHWHGADKKMRCFYRSGVECTADVGDLLPAVELALGGDPERVLRRGAAGEATRVRFTWLEKAWAKVTPEQRAAFTPAADLVIDGELLVYDESKTPKGLYDELGTRSGISAFGTAFWVRQTADGKPSGYSREDARRHYLVKVFDVLRYDGEEILRRPLHERRELLESGRCFIALPHYLELTQSDRVDLASPERPLQAAFAAARAAQAEGLMVKAAHQPYVPNARTNVLKCKVEFIEGLGDTVTLLLLGARAPRKLGAGNEASMLVEFAIGARASGAADAPIVWLFNTSPLPWRGSSLTQPMLQRLYLRLTEDAGADRPALMERLGVDEPPPAWMRQCPTSTMARPHWVLLDPKTAPIVEVMGSRFLRRYNQDTDASSNRSLPWTLRFPRVAKWCEATDGVVVDTIESFRAKAVAAFSNSGPREGDDDGAEEEAPAPPLVPLKPLTWHLAPPTMPEAKWWQAERRDAAPPTPAAASSSMPSMPSPGGAAAKRSGYPGDAALRKPKKQSFSEVVVPAPGPTMLLNVDEATRELRKDKTAIVQSCADGVRYYLRDIGESTAVVQPLDGGGEREHPLSSLRQVTGYDSDEDGLLSEVAPRATHAKRQRAGAMAGA